jgi:hypothetical protein
MAVLQALVACCHRSGFQRQGCWLWFGVLNRVLGLLLRRGLIIRHKHERVPLAPQKILRCQQRKAAQCPWTHNGHTTSVTD